MLLPLLQNNLQTVATETPAVPPVTAGGGGTYPGYAAEQSRTTQAKQAEQAPQTQPQATRTAQDAPITQGKASAPAKVNDASERAMRRSLQAAMKAAQLQALLDMRDELIARQAEQAEALRLQIDDDDEALIALLLTI